MDSYDKEEQKSTREYRKKIYNEKIDLEKIDIKDIERQKLLTSKYWQSGFGPSLCDMIRDMLRERNCNPGQAYYIEKALYEKYPKGQAEKSKISKKYSEKYDELKEKYKIKDYEDYLGFINKDFLREEDKKIIEEYEQIKKEEEIREAVERHNIILDLLDMVEKNFDLLFDETKSDFEEYVKREKKENLINIFSPNNVAALILYIITVVCLWGSMGPIILLAAPIIWIFIFIVSAVDNSIGEINYGSKWRNMTANEKYTTVNRDKIINNLANKDKWK